MKNLDEDKVFDCIFKLNADLMLTSSDMDIIVSAIMKAYQAGELFE